MIQNNIDVFSVWLIFFFVSEFWIEEKIVSCFEPCFPETNYCPTWATDTGSSDLRGFSPVDTGGRGLGFGRTFRLTAWKTVRCGDLVIWKISKVCWLALLRQIPAASLILILPLAIPVCWPLIWQRNPILVPKKDKKGSKSLAKPLVFSKHRCFFSL